MDRFAAQERDRRRVTRHTLSTGSCTQLAGCGAEDMIWGRHDMPFSADGNSRVAHTIFVQVLYAPRTLAIDTLIPFLRMLAWSGIKAIGMTIYTTTPI